MERSSRIPRAVQDGFTLVELLVVIAIIAVLAGLLLPAAGNAQNSAKKTTAKNQLVQIATAITAYETEYGRLPNFAGTNLTADNMRILLGSDSNNNPRGLSFMEVGPWKSGKGGTNQLGFCSPFNDTNPYCVMLDTNYSNLIQNVPSQNGPGGAITMTNLTRHVAVWTVWVNGKQTNLITSWD
jgi:prepilin-type N-terminal cleavage/methylation domain-containing protein